MYLPPAEPWSVSQSAGWYAHAPVWWVRRLVVGKRDADAQDVLIFLRQNHLLSEFGYARQRSPAGLERLNIKKQFWWISDVQIARISAWLTGMSNFKPAQPHRDDELLRKELYERLFGNTKSVGG